MDIETYHHMVLVPANVAVSAMRRAGMPVSLERIRETRDAWINEIARLELFVEGEAEKRGFVLTYSEKHVIPPAKLAKFLYSSKGLGLKCRGYTPKGSESTADEYLMEYASLAVPRDDDHPVVKAVLQVRSLMKGVGTYLNSFERTRRVDGCCHPQFNWALRTARISAENPPVHQIPERADKRVAEAIKRCIVPRYNPAASPEEWDPRVHGSCWRWDISGAEAAIRAAMLTDHYGVRDPVAWEYLREGKDIHSKTASLIYGVPEGTYKKGSYERDAVGKQVFFAKQYGAQWSTVQKQVYAKARLKLDDDEAQRICNNFDDGYPGLFQLYEIVDKNLLGKEGYCYDPYGRRRKVELPEGVTYLGEDDNGHARWRIDGNDDQRAWRNSQLEHAFHVFANTPTQSCNASDNLWMCALLYHGEYVDLEVPDIWVQKGVDFPEAAGWALNGGPGPGGKPMKSYAFSTVHDSEWGDCAPGYLEATAKLCWRRCRAIPLDWRLESGVPYRIDFACGPDMSMLESYNTVAKRFGLELLPD